MKLPEKEITVEIKNPEIIILLLILSVIFIMELQVTFSTPIVFGDEGYHTRMAQWIGENIEYPIWTPFEDTKMIKYSFSRPPLFNILEASFLFIFGFHESIIKFLTPFIAFLTGLSVYLLIKKLYNKELGFIASIISITIPSFVTYSVLFETDVPVTFYFSLSFLTFILGVKNENKRYWILSGIFGAFAFLSKPSGLAIYMFIFLAFLYQLITEKDYKKIFKKYFILFLILILIPSTLFLRNFYYYKAPCITIPYFDRLFNNSGCNIDNFKEKYNYTGATEDVGTTQSPLKIGITNYLNFAYGNIWFVVFSLCVGLILFFMKRNQTDILILLVLIIIIPLVSIEIMGRAEDVARYTLIWIPAISIISAKYFEELYNFIKKYQKYLALLVFIFVIIFSYLNLVEKLNTMKQVKQFSPLFFEACDWIKENTPKNAVISTFWSSRVVYSCQRNSPGCPADLRLSNDVNYTLSVAKQFGITHIFIQKFSIDTQNKHLQENFDLDFVNLLGSNPKYFKKVYENGPSLQQCLQQGGCDGNILYEINYTAF
jgi:4-amino-4-deoxy-L-arabinose transferase-like glycosyltransferase